MSKKWQTILLLALAELLAMGMWFSASAVTPALTAEWHLSSGDAAWLTMSVQIGFVVGAFLSALFNVADVWHPRYVLALGAIFGAMVNALIAWQATGLALAIPLRFLTGFALAAVYPVGMKIMATWMKEDRGLGLGLLVGALTIGSASPHLIRALGGINDWRPVLYVASALAFIAGLIVWRFGELGPFRTAPAPFRWRYIGEALSDRGVRLANFGYLGHQWELYAMWTWIPLFLLESYRQAGSTTWLGQNPERNAALVAFAVIGIGGLGSLLAGLVADRWGRTRITILSMVVSGACAVVIGFFYGHNPILVTLIALVWGFAIVADSAQFSTAVSELSVREYMGTALTMQTSLGFLLTLASIRLIPVLVGLIGWQWSFAVLAFGPMFGVWAMRALQQSPSALQLAGGRG
ncbi:MAG TPA: MFS transporter [Anaerolineae bacterium]|nr:MFS transporter [Anaerolineae bacterium]MCB0178123.1 MFS transporter [Anaerolineae bacterium]HRV95047.1 MFS transporter [Anaerolineae bacterium]